MTGPRGAARRAREALRRGRPTPARGPRGRTAPRSGLAPHYGGSVVPADDERYAWDFVGRSSKTPGAPLVPIPASRAEGPLHVAWVIPPYQRRSGGHTTLLTIARELERRGHTCSVWLHDPWGLLPQSREAIHREILEGFVPIAGEVHRDLEGWRGADVAVATGWQSVYAVKGLPGCGLKAYLVQDHEPEFHATSAQALWAEETYRAGMTCLCASPWLRDVLRERHGADAEAFELAVDHGLYRDLGRERDADTVAFYARQYTPRRGTELGILALADVVRRRPRTRIVMYGDGRPPDAPFRYEFLGVVDPVRLAELYNRAAVGMVLSLTNYSLVPQEMMASGLPVVDVRGASAEAVFGTDGELITLAEPEPAALADAVLGLLEDHERRARVARAAGAWVAGRTWSGVAGTIEAALRARLRRRAGAEGEGERLPPGALGAPG